MDFFLLTTLYLEHPRKGSDFPACDDLEEGTVITWKKGDQVINPLDDNRITVTPLEGMGELLNIKKIRATDSGQYSCTIHLDMLLLTVNHKLQVQGN